MITYTVTLYKTGVRTPGKQELRYDGVLPSGVDIWVQNFKGNPRWDRMLIEKELNK